MTVVKSIVLKTGGNLFISLHATAKPSNCKQIAQVQGGTNPSIKAINFLLKQEIRRLYILC
jgi:hypothetical protein